MHLSLSKPSSRRQRHPASTETTPIETAKTSPSGPRYRSEEDVQHENYLKKLEVPSLERVVQIAQVQEKKEREISQKYTYVDDEARERAAGTIQRTYRGHRARRQLNGLTLDPSTRWIEALKEARYRNLTRPRPRDSFDQPSTNSSASTETPTLSVAQRNWKRVGQIARRVRGEDDDNVSITSSLRSLHSAPSTHRHKSRHRKSHTYTPWTGKTLDLTYFLELVDSKHRYGANLRLYHREWVKADTNENFFFWLDCGEGKEVNIPSVGRERLEKERIRYLSREERMRYLVVVDTDGKLCWAWNGELVDTSLEWRDSGWGVVRKGEGDPEGIEDPKAELEEEDGTVAGSLIDSAPDTLTSAALSPPASAPPSNNESITPLTPTVPVLPHSPTSPARKDPKKKYHRLPHPHLPAITPTHILTRLLAAALPPNTWIFVYSTNHDLYINLKQPGAFQHSSFLHGARIMAAGLIKVSNGQLVSLSPLSGHYRPPTKAFRWFVRDLRAKGVDMRRVKWGKSYKVLRGVERWQGVKGRVKGVLGGGRKKGERERGRSEDEMEQRGRSFEELERERVDGSLRAQLKRLSLGKGGEGGNKHDDELVETDTGKGEIHADGRLEETGSETNMGLVELPHTENGKLDT